MTADDAAVQRSRAARAIRGLYGIVDLDPDDRSDFELGHRAEVLCRALLDGGASTVQLRMKGAPARSLLAAAAPLRTLTAARGALFVVNDRLDVALAAAADGVHLGQHDLPLREARALAPGLLIGISTHDEQQALAAARDGADYLGFGPVFATRSKADPDPVVGLARLAAVCRSVRAPVVAIGGISLSDVDRVVAAGAAAAAVISAVLGSPDVRAAAGRVHRAFAMEDALPDGAPPDQD